MYHAACLTLRQQNFSLLKMTFGLTIKRHHEALYSQRTDNYRTILNKKIETSETLMKVVKPIVWLDDNDDETSVNTKNRKARGESCSPAHTPRRQRR